MEQANRMVGASVIGAAMLIGLCTPSARAAFVVDLTQEGSNVVATGSGTLDLAALSRLSTGSTPAQLAPAESFAYTGPAVATPVAVYGFFTGPQSFGEQNILVFASSGSGDLVGINGVGMFSSLVVPASYVSGGLLSDSSTYDNATFASLGVTPGTHEWTWGSGANADSFTLQIGPASAIPEPSTWAMMLLGFAGLGGYAALRRKGAVPAISA
jgi:hypothetical protein